jgi:valyl-tRNA synthetase
MRASWPEHLERFVDPGAEDTFGQAMTIVDEVRAHRQAAGAPARGGALYIDGVDRSVARLAARLALVALVDEAPPGATPLASAAGSVAFPAGAAPDANQREAKRQSELKRLRDELEQTEARLANPEFQAKAPPGVQRKLQDRAVHLRAAIDRLSPD